MHSIANKKPRRLLLRFRPLFKHEPQDGELHQHGDSHHEDWRDESVDSQLQHNVEKDNMQSEVDCMTAWESEESLDGRLGAEREIARQEKVAYETDNVASDIGNIFYSP